MNMVSNRVYLDFAALVHKVRRERKGEEETQDTGNSSWGSGGAGDDLSSRERNTWSEVP